MDEHQRMLNALIDKIAQCACGHPAEVHRPAYDEDTGATWRACFVLGCPCEHIRPVCASCALPVMPAESLDGAWCDQCRPPAVEVMW